MRAPRDNTGLYLMLAIAAVVGTWTVLKIVVPVIRDQWRVLRVRRRRHYTIAAFPGHAIGSVIGKAQPVADALVAPITGRRCVYYRVTVERYYRSHARNSTGSWDVIVDDARSVPFTVDDGSGKALVDPATGGKLVLDPELQAPPEPSEHWRAFQARFTAIYDPETGQPGPLPRRWIRDGEDPLSGSAYYREAVIEVGETIAASGRGVPITEPHATLRLTHSPTHALLISDDRSTTVVRRGPR